MSVTIPEASIPGPGDLGQIDVEGTPVALANVSGDLYAFDDTCTHNGCSLADGDLDGIVVTCACHGSQFDVRTGSVMRGPAMTPVHAHAVRREGTDLVVEP